MTQPNHSVPDLASLEYLLNYKIFSSFPSLDKTAKDLTGPVSQQLVPDSLFWLEAMQINFHIFSRFFYFKIINFWGIRQNHFWKEIFISTERKNIPSFDKLDISNEKVFVINSIFFYCNLNPNSGLRHCIKSSLSSLLRISCRFQFRNLWRAWNGQH